MQKDDIDGTFLRMITSDTLRTITIRKWPIFLQMDHSRFCATSPPMQSLDNWKIDGGFAILEFLKLSQEPLDFGVSDFFRKRENISLETITMERQLRER